MGHMNVHVPLAIRCACVVGTRPEIIKMAPVIRRLRDAEWASCDLITTGQHNGLLSQGLADFGLTADFSIPHEPDNKSLPAMLAFLVGKLDALFDQIKPNCVIAQGDTTSVLAASLVAFYRQIPFVHVEAGLRTHDMSAPFPEEFHRRSIAAATFLHCAPTMAAAAHLRNENIPTERILISGNTVIDALLEIAAENPPPPANFPDVARPILLTAHRRENCDGRLRHAFAGVRKFVDAHEDTAVFFPVHVNPAARALAHDMLSGHPRIVLTEPVSYREIVGAMQRSWLILTDSGGLQEEAPALGKPVFVLRDVTERPEAVEAGVVRVIGVYESQVLNALTKLHRDDKAYRRMARPVFPYGDGHAADQIVNALRDRIVPDTTNVSVLSRVLQAAGRGR
jgi:UDP-N-acetylglucosamine 2-epimerase (non-hydrolysing)